MRQLKFRVWSTFHEPKMIYLSKGLISDLAEENKWKVMQFTGLLDTEKKEIYEGDIVEYEWDATTGSTITMKEVITDLKTAFDFEGSQETETWRVIGNIYENPELTPSI